MNIKVIKSGNDYAQAMARLTALMALDPDQLAPREALEALYRLKALLPKE